MPSTWFGLTFGAALGSGLIAGVFFAFSTSVMKALSRIPAPQGIAAMQSINVVIINPWFFTVFFGTAAACIALIALALMEWQKASSGYLFGGGLLYLLGVMAVTMVFNVPRNNALASLDPLKPESQALWEKYVRSWTLWNHVRTAASLAAGTLFTLALANR